jgi:hypothetical protein
LLATAEATPAGSDPAAVTCEKTGEVLQGAAQRTGLWCHTAKARPTRRRELEAERKPNVSIVEVPDFEKRRGEELMGLKKEFQETPQGQVVMLAVELIRSAKKFSFDKHEDGSVQAAFTISLAPDRSFRVKIERGSSGKFGLNWDPVKVVPGQAKRKSPRTR